MKFAFLIEPPFNFRTENAAISGCDVELAAHVASKLDGEPFEPIETEFTELLSGVAAGRWRMTTGLFATRERETVASFSHPIWALPDGLLVAKGNPRNIEGYRSIATDNACVLAVIRDQFQHRSAEAFGVPPSRIRIFETYNAAAASVRNGECDAYASVGRAHTGFLRRNRDGAMTVVDVPSHEKEPAFGSFAFASNDNEFRHAVDQVLDDYLGSPEHRDMMRRYGFTDKEVERVSRN